MIMIIVILIFTTLFLFSFVLSAVEALLTVESYYLQSFEISKIKPDPLRESAEKEVEEIERLGYFIPQKKKVIA